MSAMVSTDVIINKHIKVSFKVFFFHKPERVYGCNLKTNNSTFDSDAAQWRGCNHNRI